MAMDKATMAAPVTAPPSSAEMVMIACKAPNGLVLNLDHYVRVNEKDVVRRVPGKRTVTLRGWSQGVGMPNQVQLVGGYRLTPVPKDFWEAWVERNADSSFLADKIILPPASDPHAQAREHARVEQMFRPAREGDAPGGVVKMAPESNKPQEVAD